MLNMIQRVLEITPTLPYHTNRVMLEQAGSLGWFTWNLVCLLTFMKGFESCNSGGESLQAGQNIRNLAQVKAAGAIEAGLICSRSKQALCLQEPRAQACHSPDSRIFEVPAARCLLV